MKIQNILSHIVNKQGRKRERERKKGTRRDIEGGKDKKKSSGIMSGTYPWIISGNYH